MLERAKNKLYTLLKWSEKYMKTDMLYLAKGGFWLTVTKILGLGASFATSIVFANFLPEHTYGVYRYILSIAALLIIPTLGGIDDALVRSVARGQERTFFPAFTAKVHWGVLGSIGSIGLAAYYFIQGDPILAGAFLLATVFIPIMEPANLFIAYLSGKKDFKTQTTYQTIARFVSTALIIAAVFLTENVLILLAVYFISYTLLRLVFFFKIRAQVDTSTEIDPEAVPFGKHLTLISIPTVFSKTLDSILIFHFVGGAALAGYYLALVPLKQVQNILSSVNILALPNLSARSWEEIRATLPMKILKTTALMAVLIGAYWIIAEPAFRLVYPQYADMAFMSKIFMLTLLTLPANLFHTALTAHGEKAQLYIHAVSTSILRVVLLLALVPFYGANGAVASLVITSFVGIGFLAYLFARTK